MPLAIGEKAPYFSLPDSYGNPFSLGCEAFGKPVVIFFYPKDHTRTCTSEACAFRDDYLNFVEAGVMVVGVSRDSLKSHRSFAEHLHLPYPLLSDKNGEVSKAYDAKIPVLGLAKRVTYLLDHEHRIVAVHEGWFEAKAHVEAMLDHIGMFAIKEEEKRKHKSDMG